MPQLTMFAHGEIPSKFSVTYEMNPLDPDEDIRAFVLVQDHRGMVLDHGLLFVPPECIHECVLDLMEETWMGYLFGERGDIPKLVANVGRKWKAYAKAHPLT